MNVRRNVAILALSTFVSIGFAQSGVPPASGNQNSATPGTSDTQTQQQGRHHRRHSRSTSPNNSTSPGTYNNNGTPPNSTTLPNNSTTPSPNTTSPTTPATPPQR